MSGVPYITTLPKLSSQATLFQWAANVSQQIQTSSLTLSVWIAANALTPAAIPAGAVGQLLGASGVTGAAGLVSIGANLSLVAGTLSATGGGGTSTSGRWFYRRG
jgi:hypothetical protein